MRFVPRHGLAARASLALLACTLCLFLLKDKKAPAPASTLLFHGLALREFRGPSLFDPLAFTPPLGFGAGAGVLGGAVFARRVLARHCGAAAAEKLMALQDVTPRAQLRQLQAVADACPPASFLPFAGREVWPAAADAVVLDTDVGGLWDASEVVLARLGAGCPSPPGPVACTVFLHTDALAASAGGVLAFLAKLPAQRLVLLSSSNDDCCVPWCRVAAGPSLLARQQQPLEADSSLLTRLLLHPRVVAWFAENPCLSHPKLHPLPLGPAFRTSREFGAEDVHAAKRSALAMVADGLQLRSAERQGLLVRLTLATSDDPMHALYRGVRRDNIAHMLALAEALGGSEGGDGRGSAGITGSVMPGKAPEALNATDGYKRDLARALFAWAPPGRGIDSHRAWECMLAGCVPIVLRTTLSPLYAGMAVLQVDDFGRLTARELKRAAELLASSNTTSAPAPQLYAFYWLALIEQAARQ